MGYSWFCRGTSTLVASWKFRNLKIIQKIGASWCFLWAVFQLTFFFPFNVNLGIFTEVKTKGYKWSCKSRIEEVEHVDDISRVHLYVIHILWLHIHEITNIYSLFNINKGAFPNNNKSLECQRPIRLRFCNFYFEFSMVKWYLRSLQYLLIHSLIHIF